MEETGTVAQLVDHSLCDGEVVGSFPHRVIPKTLKNGTSCSFAWHSALRKKSEESELASSVLV